MSIMDWLGLPVLVTGGAGFIGSNLVRRLCALGARVTAVDAFFTDCGANPFNLHGLEAQVDLHRCDLAECPHLPGLVVGQRVIFNLAGDPSHLGSMRDPLLDLARNCASQLALLEACRNHNPGVRLIHASTRQVYGRPQYLPVDERHPLAPVDINGVHKLASEGYYMLYHRVHGLATTIVRLTNTYGPRMRVRDARQTFIGAWLRAAVERQPLRLYGDGQQVRDLTFVEDVLAALLHVAACPGTIGQIYNLGGETVSLRALAELLVHLSPGTCIEYVPFPVEQQVIDIGDYWGDDALLQEATGWAPTTPLRDGVQASLTFYRNHARYYW